MLKIAVVAVALLPVNALAAFKDGNSLYDNCRSAKPVALGYVVGVYDTINDRDLVTTEAGDNVFLRRKMCLPQGVTSGQLLDISCKYLADNPNKRHYPAFTVVDASLSEAFPCTGR